MRNLIILSVEPCSDVLRGVCLFHHTSAVGCANPALTAGTVLERSGDEAQVRCRDGGGGGGGDRVIGRGVCMPDGEWRGTLTNCTAADGGGDDLGDKASAAVAQRSLLTRGQTCVWVCVCACEKK